MLIKIVLGRGPLALPFLSKMERGFRWPPLALFIFFRKCKEGVAIETLPQLMQWFFKIVRGRGPDPN